MNQIILIFTVTYTKFVQQEKKSKKESPKRRKVVTHFVLNASLIRGIYPDAATFLFILFLVKC